MGRVGGGLVVLALLAAGCGASPSEQSAPLDASPPEAVQKVFFGDAARTVAAPAGFRTRRVSVGTGTLTMALPQRWPALDAMAARSPGVSQTLAATNPGLAPFLAGLALPESPLRLLAFDPGGNRRHPTTALVLFSPAPPQTAYGRWAPAVLAKLRALPSISGGVDARRVHLPAGDALEARYSRTYRGQRIVTRQYVLATRAGMATLAFTAPAPAAGPLRHALAVAARTLSEG